MDEQYPLLLIPIWSRNLDARPVVVEWDADLPDTYRWVQWWEDDGQHRMQVHIELLTGRAPVRLREDDDERTPRRWYRFGTKELPGPSKPGNEIPTWVLVAIAGALARRMFAREIEAAIQAGLL